MKRDAVKENVRLAALEKVAFFSDLKNQTQPEERRFADHLNLFLAGLVHQSAKRLLPGEHLDHFHAVDDLVHESDPPISLGGSFNP